MAELAEQERRMCEQVSRLTVEFPKNCKASRRPMRGIKKVAELKAAIDSVQQNAADQEMVLGKAHEELPSALNRIEGFEVKAQQTMVTPLQRASDLNRETSRLLIVLRVAHVRVSELKRQLHAKAQVGGSAAATRLLRFALEWCRSLKGTTR